MNTLSRLDFYLSSFFPSSRLSLHRLSTPPSSSHTSDAGPSSAQGISPVSIRQLSNLPPTPRKRKARPRPPLHSRDRKYSNTNLKIPPPNTPVLLRIALVLWSILLTFWRSLVGETRAEREWSSKKKRKRKGNNLNTIGNAAAGAGGGGVGVGVLERVMISAGIPIPTDSEIEGDGDGTGSDNDHELEQEDGWIDPVTRAPDTQESLDTPPPDEDEFAATLSSDQDRNSTRRGPEPTPMSILGSTSKSNDDDGDKGSFSFRLRSAKPISERTTIEESALDTNGSTPAPPPQKRIGRNPSFTSAFQRQPPPASILSNPLAPTPNPNKPSTAESTSIASSSLPTRPVARLLANPISTSLLDPSVPAPTTNSFLTGKQSSSQLNRTTTRIHQTPFHLQKTLILDLDETLIHSTSRPLTYANTGNSGGGGILGLSLGGLLGTTKSKGRKEGHTVEVVLNGRSTTYHVYKRPYVDHFLKKVASWYTLVIFTASMPEYADPVIDWLDGGRGLFAKKLYRESCHLQPNGSYVKDLALVESDLARVCFMDNSPVSYNWNKANALPIEGWTSDPNDEALLHSIPVLDSLRFVNDVRRVLGIRGFT